MNTIIGLWFCALAITILVVWLEDSFSIKEKIKGVICIMAFITLIFASAIFLAGGVTWKNL